MGLGLFFPFPQGVHHKYERKRSPRSNTTSLIHADSNQFISRKLPHLSPVLVGNMMNKRCRLWSTPGNRHEHDGVMKEYQGMKEEIKARALKEEWDLLIKDYNVCVSGGLVKLQYALQKLFRVRDGIITTLSPASVNCVFGPMDDASIVQLVEGLGEVGV